MASSETCRSASGGTPLLQVAAAMRMHSAFRAGAYGERQRRQALRLGRDRAARGTRGTEYGKGAVKLGMDLRGGGRGYGSASRTPCCVLLAAGV